MKGLGYRQQANVQGKRARFDDINMGLKGFQVFPDSSVLCLEGACTTPRRSAAEIKKFALSAVESEPEPMRVKCEAIKTHAERSSTSYNVYLLIS